MRQREDGGQTAKAGLLGHQPQLADHIAQVLQPFRVCGSGPGLSVEVPAPSQRLNS
jgi:hypothetical protein